MEDSNQNLRPRNFHISQLANKRTRFFNFLVDIVIIYIIYFVYALVTSNPQAQSSYNHDSSSPHLNFSFIIIYSIYYILFEYLNGKTLGKFITGTTVLTEDGLKPPFMTLFVRTLCRLIPFEPFSFLFSTTGWHDSITGTIVVSDHVLIMPKETNTNELKKNGNEDNETSIEGIEEKNK